MVRKRIITAVAAVLVLLPGAVSAQNAGVQPLAEVAFMAGCWRGEFGDGDALEEYYTTAASDVVLGVSRFMRGGRTVQHEFSRIARDSAGIALLPYPNGRPSEHVFRLTSSDERMALFEAPEHDFPKRIRYSLSADGTLTARIDGGEGDARVQEWSMNAISCREDGDQVPLRSSGTASPALAVPRAVSHTAAMPIAFMRGMLAVYGVDTGR